MPYVYRSFPQAVDYIDPGVQDVYHSPDVYVNSVPVALWQPPGANGGTSTVSVPPDPPVLDYAPNAEQRENYVRSYQDSFIDPEVGYITEGGNAGQEGSMAGGGDPPGVNTSDANDLSGNPDTTGATTIGGSGVWTAVYNYLARCLQEAAAGQWKEITPAKCPSCPANPKIMHLYTQMGFSRQQLDKAGNYSTCGDQTPWCAAFVGTVLKECGAPYVKGNLSAIAYNNVKWGGRPVGKTNYQSWRELDVLVKPSGKYNHVGFVRAVDPKSGRYLLTGGNQDNTVNTKVFSDLGSIYNVFRFAELPSEYDKSIIRTITQKGGAVNTR